MCHKEVSTTAEEEAIQVASHTKVMLPSLKTLVSFPIYLLWKLKLCDLSFFFPFLSVILQYSKVWMNKRMFIQPQTDRESVLFKSFTGFTQFFCNLKDIHLTSLHDPFLTVSVNICYCSEFQTIHICESAVLTSSLLPYKQQISYTLNPKFLFSTVARLTKHEKFVDQA